MKDLTNQVFGLWKVLNRSEYTDKRKNPYWTCECQCENKTIKEINQYSLTNGTSKCCGCKSLHLENLKIEMIDKIFGKLKVISYYDKQKSVYRWLCKCECGNDKDCIVDTYSLKKLRVKSCGCSHFDKTDEQIQVLRNRRLKYNTYDLTGEYGIGYTIKGEEFYFDLEDYDKIISINKYWKINNSGYVLCYYLNKEFQMHRYLMDLAKYDKVEDIIVDHKDGNRIDNRKNNLRVCERKHNPKNARLYDNNTSGHKGVSWLSRLNKWQVSIQCDKKNIYLGVYEDFDEAVQVRKEAEIKYFGKYSRDYSNE